MISYLPTVVVTAADVVLVFGDAVAVLVVVPSVIDGVASVFCVVMVEVGSMIIIIIFKILIDYKRI